MPPRKKKSDELELEEGTVQPVPVRTVELREPDPPKPGKPEAVAPASPGRIVLYNTGEVIDPARGEKPPTYKVLPAIVLETQNAAGTLLALEVFGADATARGKRHPDRVRHGGPDKRLSWFWPPRK